MGTMARFEDTVTIDAPVEKVFAFVKDVGKLWACFPDVAVREVVLTPEGVGSHAEWYVRMFFLHYQGRIEITEVVPDKRIAVKSSAGPVFTFTLTPQDDGSTEFRSVVEWSSGVPIVGKPIEGIMASIGAGDFQAFIANIKAAVEGVAPEPVQPTAAHTPGATLTRSVTIDAPVEEVAADVLHIGAFWAAAHDVAVREEMLTPEGVGSTARLYSHMGPLHMEGAVEIVEVVPNERVSAKVHFGPESPLWTFTFAPTDGGTLLTGQGEWHLNVPGVGKRLAAMEANSHGEFLEEMLAGAKRRVEESALVG
jgi:uncharacterized protein YndB with AHSA1/START domain